MIIWDLELTMTRQVIGARQWHIARMVQGSYFPFFVTWFYQDYVCLYFGSNIPLFVFYV
jgi:hypothetical protein